MQAGRPAGHVNPAATDLPPNDGEPRDPPGRSRKYYILVLLLCAIVALAGGVAVAVRVGPIIADGSSRLWKNPMALNIGVTHYEMPRRHYFTDSREQVLILEQALERNVQARNPGLESATEILAERIREGETSALATLKLLTEDIPLYCAGAWSTSTGSKAKVKSLKHHVARLKYQAGNPASRIREALDSTQKIRLIVKDEVDATIKAMRQYDKDIDQTGRGLGSLVAWFSDRSKDPAEYARLQALRQDYDEVLMALDRCENALWADWGFWTATQTAIEIASLPEAVGRLDLMVEEGPFDEEVAEKILLKVLEVVQNAVMGE